MIAIGRAFGMPSDAPICNRNRPRPEANSRFLSF
jgi:hypothetical protein